MMVATGHGNYIPRDKVVGVVAFQEELRELIEAAKRSFRYMDHTGGRTPKSIVHLEPGFIAVTSIRPDTMALRIKNPATEANDD